MAEVKQEFNTALTKVNNTFFPLIERQLSGNGVVMDGYSKQCVLNAISAMHTTLDSKDLTWSNPQLDNSNITQVLLSVASLKLNAAASPREVYFQIRNVKTSLKDEKGKEIWKKQIEMGIEGDGNDAILSRFGRDVDKVAQFWLVRENDHFEYPSFNGLEMTPPRWTPTGKGEVIRVVYPVVKKDGTVEFYISERDDVAKNIMAHISNNMMNETFGITESKFKATPAQKKEIDAKKKELILKAKELGIAVLDEPTYQKWISPAWTEFHSRESMFIRKMRNNVVKKIPKDFGNAFIEMTYHENTDETLKLVSKEVAENANREIIDITPENVQDAEYEEPEGLNKDTGEIEAPPAEKPEDEAPPTDGPDF